MSAALLGGYGLAAVGLALIVSAIGKAFGANINVAVANAQLIKLAKAGNLSRTRKLCAAAPGSYFDAVSAAIAAIPNDSRDRVTIESIVHSTFDEAARPIENRWRANNERGLLGAIVVGGALGAAYAHGPPAALLVVAGVAGLATIWLLLRRTYMTNALARVRADVLPAIVDAAAAGGAESNSTTELTKPMASTPTADVAPAPDPFRSPGDVVVTAPNLRDGKCPLCKATDIKTVDRGDPRFTTLVCPKCGFAQEFADLARV